MGKKGKKNILLTKLLEKKKFLMTRNHPPPPPRVKWSAPYLTGSVESEWCGFQGVDNFLSYLQEGLGYHLNFKNEAGRKFFSPLYKE